MAIQPSSSPTKLTQLIPVPKAINSFCSQLVHGIYPTHECINANDWLCNSKPEIATSFKTRNWLQARLSVYPPQNYLKLANNFLSQTCRKFVKDIFSALYM